MIEKLSSRLDALAELAAAVRGGTASGEEMSSCGKVREPSEGSHDRRQSGRLYHSLVARTD